MNYPITDDDRAVLERAQALVEELIPHEVEAEMNEGELPPDVKARHRRRVRELGLTAINMPRELGGAGLTTFQQVLVSEQIGKVTNALGWVVETPAGWLPEVATDYVTPAGAQQRRSSTSQWLWRPSLAGPPAVDRPSSPPSRARVHRHESP
jgi:alkylation response protein AidB-like acyl-CoA dehydrogenase